MDMLPILWKQNNLCSSMGILLHLFRFVVRFLCSGSKLLT
uniref:Uncharacterized protein n=1 Tax=Medicago truncatula TaxID=3880 RepID=I3T9H7_MEDTR|nr:unknown [Medicago truncatula]